METRKHLRLIFKEPPCSERAVFLFLIRKTNEEVASGVARKRAKVSINPTIVVPKLKRIANFDDLDPLKIEPSISLEIIERGTPLPQDAALILIPGSKSTISDLEDFYDQGWDIDLKAHLRRGGKILGICGGYQMLGKMRLQAYQL